MPENFCANTSHLSLKICIAHFGKGLVVANFLYKKINIHKYTTFPNSYWLHSGYLGLPSGFQGSLKTFNCVQIPWHCTCPEEMFWKWVYWGFNLHIISFLKQTPPTPNTCCFIYLFFTFWMLYKNTNLKQELSEITNTKRI